MDRNEWGGDGKDVWMVCGGCMYLCRCGENENDNGELMNIFGSVFFG